MTPSFESLLVLGVVGFYLFDATLFLHVNEMVLWESAGRWFFACPGPRWQLFGRTPYLPNPLTPGRPLFRVRWPADGGAGPCGSPFPDPGAERAAVGRFIAALRPLQWQTGLLLGLLLVAMPAVLMIAGTGSALLLVFACVYCVIAAMLIQTYRRRAVLGVSGSAFAKLAFDALACAPFALNLVRRISLHRSLAGDPVGFARAACDAPTWARLVGVLRERVDEQLEYEDEHSPRYRGLVDFRGSLEDAVS